MTTWDWVDLNRLTKYEIGRRFIFLGNIPMQNAQFWQSMRILRRLYGAEAYRYCIKLFFVFLLFYLLQLIIANPSKLVLVIFVSDGPLAKVGTFLT